MVLSDKQFSKEFPVLYRSLNKKKAISVSSKKYSKIPKTIHQIWLGPTQPPLDWMDTWKTFAEKYKWKYNLITDRNLPKLTNQIEFDNANSYQEKSDILRYELL